jgi:hypothetical protein
VIQNGMAVWGKGYVIYGNRHKLYVDPDAMEMIRLDLISVDYPSDCY